MAYYDEEEEYYYDQQKHDYDAYKAAGSFIINLAAYFLIGIAGYCFYVLGTGNNPISDWSKENKKREIEYYKTHKRYPNDPKKEKLYREIIKKDPNW